MEHTDKTRIASHTRRRILTSAGLTLAAFAAGHASFMDGCFPAATALITYALSKNIANIYLIIPILCGMMPLAINGYEIWADAGTVCICALLFIFSRSFTFKLWHRAVLAVSVRIICGSIYALATAGLYKFSADEIIVTSLMIAGFVFAFDIIADTAERGQERANHSKAQLFASFTAAIILIVCSAGAYQLILPLTVFLCLWVSVCSQVYCTAIVAVTGSVMAALAGQEQWGAMATLIIASAAAEIVKPAGAPAVISSFVATAAAMKYVESGVVLGIEYIGLFPPAILFMLLYIKAGKRMSSLINKISGEACGYESREIAANRQLKERAAEMAELSRFYATYLDSRSMLADQFEITARIIDHARQEMRKKKHDTAKEKLQFEIYASQSAASGTINGDCCGWHDIGDGRTAMIISDGMGKGKKAAAESLMVVRTVTSLLRAGVDAGLALKLVNTVMLMKNDEDSFATVDLMIADRKSGKAKLYKTGAAPTLLRRKNSVEEIRLSAVPLGIVNGLKMDYVEATLKRGDWIVMMSDGVSDGGDSRGGNNDFLDTVKSTVADVRSNNPEVMCELILGQASDSYIGRERDDLTVMVARVV